MENLTQEVRRDCKVLLSAVGDKSEKTENDEVVRKLH